MFKTKRAKYIALGIFFGLMLTGGLIYLFKGIDSLSQFLVFIGVFFVAAGAISGKFKIPSLGQPTESETDETKKEEQKRDIQEEAKKAREAAYKLEGTRHYRKSKKTKGRKRH